MELLFSLIAGLIIAFALQLLLANLGIALGLTVLDLSPKEKQSSKGTDISLPITHLLGFGVALSLSTVLFAAGLLTTEFSEIAAPRRGIIFGIILWASYWMLFLWLSSTTLSNLADSLLATALGSGRRLISAISQGINRTEQNALQQLTEEVSELIKEQQQFSQQLAEQREALIAEMEILAAEQQASSSVEPLADEPVSVEIESTPSSTLSPSSVMARLNIPTGRQLLDRAMDRVSDVDVQTLWHQFRQNGTISAEAVIPQDVADYLQQVPVWMFQPDVLKETFSDRLYDPEASPEEIKAQLMTIDRSHLVDWLQERGDLAAEQVEALADSLSNIKDAVMAAMPSTSESVAPEVLEDIQDRLIAYCRYTNLDLLTPNSLIEKVQSQLEEHAIATPSAVAQQLDLEEIKAVLGRRQGLSAANQEKLVKALRSALPQSKPLRAPRRWAVRSGQSAQNFGQQLAKQVGYYLQYQDKAALNPSQMAKDLSHLAKTSLTPLFEHLPDPTNLGSSLSEYVPDSLFDQQVWKRALEKRRDMTTAEVQQILAGTESVWQQTLQQVNSWADVAWADVQETIKSKNSALLNAASHQMSEGLSSAQEALSNRMDAVKTDLQTQADAARGQVAIASWWLFSSLLLSGLSAAASGWLAILY